MKEAGYIKISCDVDGCPNHGYYQDGDSRIDNFIQYQFVNKDGAVQTFYYCEEHAQIYSKVRENKFDSVQNYFNETGTIKPDIQGLRLAFTSTDANVISVNMPTITEIIAGESVKLPEPVAQFKAGYEFASYMDSQKKVYQAGDTVKVNGDKIMYILAKAIHTNKSKNAKSKKKGSK